MSNKMMKAVMQTAYGEPSKVLQIMSVPIPSIPDNSDQVLVQVKAVSVNPLDYLLVRGGLKFVWEVPMPASVGADFSGVVAKAGKKSGFKEGDEVMGSTSIQKLGSFAEYVTVPATNCIPKPSVITHEQAACLPVVAVTAAEAFSLHSGPQDTAFIPAGMGGVGHVALQLAKPLGGFKKTITTVSTGKVALVKEHIKDVDEVIDYTKVDLTQAIPAGSVDFALDQFGQPASYVRYMRKPPRGTQGKPSIISISTPPNAEKSAKGWEMSLNWRLRVLLNLMDWWTRLWIPGWIHYDSFFALGNEEIKRSLVQLVEEGKLRPVIDRVYEMDQAVEALARAETKPAGKVVIRISE